MAEPAVYEYLTLDALSVRLGHAPGDVSPWKQQLIQAASDEVNAHCKRVFTPYEDTLIYDAPARAVRDLEDWIDIDAITVDGNTIDPNLYLLITRAPEPASPYTLTSLYPHWAGVRLRSGTWAELGARLTVTGTRGYAATIPAAVTLATLEMAVSLWEADTQHWSDGGAPGYPGAGGADRLVPLRVVRLLHRLVLGQEGTPWPS